MKKVVFIDRDGVINHEAGYVHTINEFRFISGVFEMLKYLQDKGYTLIIITNQSGIGRGYYTTKDFHKLTQWMLKEFSKRDIFISDVLFCPHTPDDECDCRKPRAGMLESADKLHNIDKKNSWLIGDKEDDITAAHTFGISNTILVESGHKIDKKNSNASHILPSIKEINGVI